MAVNIYRISREYVWWKIESPDGFENATVEVACIPNPTDVPAEEDWVDATLVSPTDELFGDGENWWVRLLVGPGIEGDIDLSEGEGDYPRDFQSWIRITDNPERPVRKPGVITVI